MSYECRQNQCDEEFGEVESMMQHLRNVHEWDFMDIELLCDVAVVEDERRAMGITEGDVPVSATGGNTWHKVCPEGHTSLRQVAGNEYRCRSCGDDGSTKYRGEPLNLKHDDLEDHDTEELRIDE